MAMIRRRPSHTISKIFCFESARPIKAKFDRKFLSKGGTSVFMNNPGHMTKMATLSIYGKNPSKIFSGTGEHILSKLGIKHQLLKYHNVFINHDPVMTLTYMYFTTRSTKIACAFEL